MSRTTVHQPPANGPANGPSSRALWWAYAGLVLAVGMLLSVAELQHYLAWGRPHLWEPFLWELSSVVTAGGLCVLLYHGHVRVLRQPRRAVRVGLHLLGALAYVLVHVGVMFGIRWAVYGLAGVPYQPGSALQIFAYEAGKDLVSYSLFAGICHGIHLYFESQRRQREMAQLQAELAEARLTRLAEQIQPHFLFNTLNLVSSVMYEDVPRADRILCQLADLLRQALAAQQAGWHTLAEELQLVEPFLAIMQARFGPRLQVRIEASDAARRCQVPALLLISPVENAIKHDVATSSREVEVALHAWVEGQALHVTVANSGAAPERTEREGALGLSNLKERVRAHFGAAGRVALAAGAAGGSVLSIQLPMPAGSAA